MQPWHDFLLLTGGAAATLLGLVFVAASIAATIPNEKLGDDKTRQLWVLPIVWAFIRVLVVSALGLIPGQTRSSFGYLLLVLAILDVGRMARTTIGLREHHRSRDKLSASDWGWYVIYPLASTLVLAGVGLALSQEWAIPVQLVAAGL